MLSLGHCILQGRPWCGADGCSWSRLPESGHYLFPDGLPVREGSSREPSVWLLVLNKKTFKLPAGVEWWPRGRPDGGGWGGENAATWEERAAGIGTPVPS